LICLYLYEYLLLCNIPYIIRNGLRSTFQYKFDCASPSSCSWNISRQSFYSYWWPNISVICCYFCTSCICADSPHLGLSSATWFRKIGPLAVEIQAEWSLWHNQPHILITYFRWIWQSYHLFWVETFIKPYPSYSENLNSWRAYPI